MSLLRGSWDPVGLFGDRGKDGVIVESLDAMGLTLGNCGTRWLHSGIVGLGWFVGESWNTMHERHQDFLRGGRLTGKE